MTTSNDPRGRLAELYTARQTALTAAATDGFVRRAFYDWSPSPQSEPQDDEIMGDGQVNTVDAREAAPDIERGSVRVSWPLDLNQIGWALTELLGAPTTTGADDDFTHTFTSSTVQIPTTTVERKLKSGAFDGAIGAVMRSLQFPLGADRGYTRVAADYLTRQQPKQYAVSIAGGFATPVLTARVPRAVGSITLDGSALAAVISGDVTLSNVLGEDAYHGSSLIDDVQLEGRTLAVNLTGRFKGAAMRDLGELAVGKFLPDAHDLVLTWSLGATLSLVLTLRNLRFAKTGVATAGPGRLDVPLRARGEVGAANPMITAVLRNATEDYA